MYKVVYEDLHSFLFSFIEIEDDKDVKNKSKLDNKETDTFKTHSEAEESKKLVEHFYLLVLGIYIFPFCLHYETFAIESVSKFVEGDQVSFVFMSSSNVHDKSPSLAEAFATSKKIKKCKLKSGNCI